MSRDPAYVPDSRRASRRRRPGPRSPVRPDEDRRPTRRRRAALRPPATLTGDRLGPYESEYEIARGYATERVIILP